MAIVNFNSISGVSTISATSSITVGDTVIKNTSISIGTTDTTGRNAGVGTATGTVIFNSSLDSYQGYFGNDLGWQTITSAFSATGGTLIEDGSYKYNVFTSPGSLIVAGSRDIEFLLVAGGGAMTSGYGSGGGAGGISHATAWTVSTGTYPIEVGSGGVSAGPPNTGPGAINAHGGNSTFNGVTSVGGGVGFHDALENPQPWTPQINGGSGGGTGDDNAGGAGTGTQPAQPTHGGLVTNYGRPGFAPESGNAPGSGNQNCGGGGAGQGGGPEGSPGPSVTGEQRTGGNGQAFPSFPAPVLAPAIPAPVRPTWTPAVGPTGLFGGGGGGAGNTPGPYAGGPGGGGAGTATAGSPGTPGVNYTGGGGGAVYTSGTGGSGGNGIFIIKYLT
jgi:hypothetical protein